MFPRSKSCCSHKPEVGGYGGGSEAANALAAPAIAAALYDADREDGSADSPSARVRAGSAQNLRLRRAFDAGRLVVILEGLVVC